MSRNSNICAVVPVKERAHAKQRLAGVLSPAARQALACAMPDLFGRALRSTEIGLADELAAARFVPLN
jgi:2-phospho-L-lactate guanylyltransferase (CobY/MobA/RfbA family)